MLADLTSYIQSIQNQQHQIFLRWDDSSTIADPEIQVCMATCNLYDVQHQCKFTIPINTSTIGRQIDLLLGTELLHTSLRRCSILNFNNSPLSDHRALFADFDKTAIFQSSTINPTLPSQRLHQINNPTQCQKYIKLVKINCSQHRVEERSDNLQTLSPSNAPIESLSSLFDALDCNTTKALLHAK